MAPFATVEISVGEYVRGRAYTNTAELFFALLKRGVYGTFHHVSAKRLFRYTDEFTFRRNTKNLKDNEIIDIALKKGDNKCLAYASNLKIQIG